MLSTAGAVDPGVGYLLPLIYLAWSLFRGAGRRRQPVARDRPRMADAVAAADRELQSQPVVTQEAYAYDQ